MAASANKEIKIDMEKLSVREADEKMFGREKEKEEIIDQLMSAVTNPPAVPVIIIAGLSGIGKTMLARHVCRDHSEQIGKPVWVENVSPFDPDNMAKQVIGDNTTAASSSTVNPNRIIILDGFEAEIQHDQLKALQDKLLEKKGIRVAAIIITTRSSCCVVKNIIADSPVKSYALEGLNKEDSLSLFQTILGPDAAHHSSITQDVVNKCRGVPRAIQIMAELLHSRPSPLTEFMKKLTNSYHYERLPRSCFTYCSLLPQDYEFDAERLIHLWAAEGFLRNPSTSPEEIGRDYLRELAGKSIFHDVKEDELGEIRSCRMHPLMHDIARFLNLNDTENIPLDPYGGEKVHHQLLRASFDLSLLGLKDGIPASLFEKAKELKTFMFFNTGSLQVDILKNMLKSFKKLCVLDLRDAGINKEVPRSIGELKELKYLDLSLNGMEELPSSISKLSKLQTLKLYRCHSLKELPKNFEKLKNLKHLDMRLCMALTCMPREMNKLTSLQTLSAFAVSKKDPRESLEELAKLTQLRGYLDIFYLDRVPKPRENEETKYLEEIQNLHSLTLRWDLGDTKGSDHKSVLDLLDPHSDLRALMLEGYGGPTLSRWLTSRPVQFNDLVSLRLEDCRGCKYLSEQDRLPKIKILRLVRLQNLEYIIAHKCDKDADFYKNLEELTIKACRKLKTWWKTEIEVNERPFFARISKLDVRKCPELTCMPLYPRLEGSTFSFGKEVFLEDTSLKLLLDTISCGTGEEDFSKTSIPLENLHIQNCIQLDKLFDAFKHMSSLQCLTLREIPNPESLTFDNLTTLRELTLENCDKLTSISESIGRVTSLRKMKISKCNNLKSLPKTMNKINLKTLIIVDCNKYVQGVSRTPATIGHKFVI